MGARKDKRRKLARKVIRRAIVGNAGDYLSADPLTFDLSDREFDALVAEIRAAKVTVTWKTGT